MDEVDEAVGYSGTVGGDEPGPLLAVKNSDSPLEPLSENDGALLLCMAISCEEKVG